MFCREVIDAIPFKQTSAEQTTKTKRKIRECLVEAVGKWQKHFFLKV